MSIGILPNVSSVKLNRDVKPGMSVYSRTTRLTSNQIKSPKKLPFPQRKRKRRQKCCGYCEHCTTIGLRLARLGNTVFSKRKTVPGKPMQKVLGSIRQVRFTQSTLRQVSIRENKGPSHGKIQVKLPHQRSPNAVKFEDSSHEETARQQRCAQSKAWNLAENIHKLKEKDKTTFYSPSEEWVLSVT